MSIQLGIVDYDAGNLRSVRNTFASLGIEPIIVQSPDQFTSLTHLVLPGVGSFGDCVQKLRSKGFEQPILDWIKAEKPFLGICVGYQILFEDGEESPGIPGLGVLKGHVVKFNLSDPSMKVPHMGWDSIQSTQSNCPMWESLNIDSYFYFVHSYYPIVDNKNIVSATCTYGTTFDTAICLNNLWATQFHPEKSQKNGTKLLSNFLKLS